MSTYTVQSGAAESAQLDLEAAIMQAYIEAEHVIQFDYPSSETAEPVWRTFSPWEILAGGVLGWDHDREAPRRYRFDRRGDETVIDLDAEYVRPA